MAVLRCEDEDYKTSLEIQCGDAKIIQNQMWQRFTLILTSGTYQLKLGGKSASVAEGDACLFCRKPKDEVANLIDKLRQLVDFDRDKLLFDGYRLFLDHSAALLMGDPLRGACDPARASGQGPL